MNLILRLLAVFVGSTRRSRLEPFDTSVVQFRVLPNDLDLNFHMNNGRYLSLMDLGRLDLISRIGITRTLFRLRWRPVVGSLTIRFRRSLEPFQRYRLASRMLGWDGKWFFLEQRFLRGEELVALAVVKGLFLGPEGRVPPQAVVDLVAPGLASPPLPEAVERWQEAEEAIHAGGVDG